MSEWKRVSDKLPELNRDVQLYVEVDACESEQIVGFRIDEENFQFATYEGVKICCQPTHWMPLPEPPK